MRRWGAAAVLVAVSLSLLVVSGVLPARAGEPLAAKQWGLRQIKAPDAWATATGAGVPVAVIDTGVDASHPDLAGRVAATATCVGTNGDPGRCAAGATDSVGHGTHVAGIALASADGAGIAGVAPNARLFAVDVFERDRGREVAYDVDILAAVRWVVRTADRPGVVNLSLGPEVAVLTLLADSRLPEAVEEAWRAGWVVAIASGNTNLFGLGSANYGDLDGIVVGATGPDGRVASYSSPPGNAKWAVVAPGGDSRGSCSDTPDACVLSTWPGGRFAYQEGTSMATPHVAGAAALLAGLGLRNDQVVERLLATADRSVACGSGCAGRLDAGGAVASVAPASPPPTAKPAVPPPESVAPAGPTSPARGARTAPAAPASSSSSPSSSSTAAESAATTVPAVPAGPEVGVLEEAAPGTPAAAPEPPPRPAGGDEGVPVSFLVLALVAGTAVLATAAGAARAVRAGAGP